VSTRAGVVNNFKLITDTCRGVVAVEVFRRIVELSGQPIHEMFDYICGVSTGAILAFLLGIKKIPIDDVAQIYR